MGPLAGIRVLDLSRILAGPWCTQALSDLGAEVIKVERPGVGDDTRAWGPPFVRTPAGEDTPDSAYFMATNRGKRSITLDISTPDGQAVARRLAAVCDVAIENYNQLNLTLTFVRGSTGCDVTISAKTTSGVGGSSGFPSGGKPYGTINIGTGLQSYSVDVNEHVITHEIGHTIGFRHSDYYNRSISCGTGGNAPTLSIHSLGRGLPKSNPIYSPRFRVSASGMFQSAAFATRLPPHLYAFHRYTGHSACLYFTQALQFQMQFMG